MGTDKALLLLAGKPLMVHAAARLSQIAATVVIACGEEEREAYRALHLPMIPDRYPGLGPLAGLHAALMEAGTEWVALLACDLPFASEGLLRHMLALIAAGTATQAIVPVTSEGKVQPLLSLYHRSILPLLEEALVQKELRVMDLLANLVVHYVHEGDYPEGPGTHDLSLLNMNTPEDYEAALKLASI